jgi:hypothetical protein
MWKPRNFLGKFSLLFLFSFYPYFDTFLFQAISMFLNFYEVGIKTLFCYFAVRLTELTQSKMEEGRNAFKILTGKIQ